MKIALVSSAGGHHQDMLQIIEAFEGHDVFYIVLPGANTRYLKNKHAYFVRGDSEEMKKAKIPRLNLLKATFLNSILAIKIMARERPRVVVSTGGFITVPFCYVGKLFGAKIVYLESIVRIDTISFSGKVLYPIADVFLVQWESLLSRYKRAKYWGKVV